MKTLYFLFLLAFLVFQVQSDQRPPIQHEAQIKEALEKPAYQADRAELKTETAEFRAAVTGCNGWKGYCLPRTSHCRRGRKFKEQFNNCPNKWRYQCCSFKRLRSPGINYQGE